MSTPTELTPTDVRPPVLADAENPPGGITPEIEARFLEQDHRPVRIWHNWWLSRDYPAGDPRKEAAVKAVFWWIFSPATVAVAGAGFTAVASLGVLVWQTTLLREQNAFFKEQNQAIHTQIEFQSSQDMRQRRTMIFAALYERDEGVNEVGAKANSRTRTEALLEFVPMERKLQSTQKEGKVSLEGAFLDQVQVVSADFSNVSFAISRLRNTSFQAVNFSGCDFRAATFENTNFPYCDLRQADFEGCNLNGARLGVTDLRDANLSSADLKGILLLGSDLRGARLHFIKNWDKIETIKLANIAGVVGAPDGFREWALEKGAVEELDDARFNSLIQRLIGSGAASNTW
jgi:uncharacterized protein YjbI with pentapeptide repeats